MGRCILTLTRVILEGEYKDSYQLDEAKSGRLNLHLKWTPQPIFRDSWSIGGWNAKPPLQCMLLPVSEKRVCKKLLLFYSNSLIGIFVSVHSSAMLRNKSPNHSSLYVVLLAVLSLEELICSLFTVVNNEEISVELRIIVGKEVAFFFPAFFDLTTFNCIDACLEANMFL